MKGMKSASDGFLADDKSLWQKAYIVWVWWKAVSIPQVFSIAPAAGAQKGWKADPVGLILERFEAAQTFNVHI